MTKQKEILTEQGSNVALSDVIGSPVRPKENMEHIWLSKEREYKVLGILFGSFQINNDRGVIDYYAPTLFRGFQ
jgi:hypothetical protein